MYGRVTIGRKIIDNVSEVAIRNNGVYCLVGTSVQSYGLKEPARVELTGNVKSLVCKDGAFQGVTMLVSAHGNVCAATYERYNANSCVRDLNLYSKLEKQLVGRAYSGKNGRHTVVKLEGDFVSIVCLPDNGVLVQLAGITRQIEAYGCAILNGENHEINALGTLILKDGTR